MKGTPMTKPKILITKAERAEFAQDRADKKFRDKMTKAIRKLADANAAFDTFTNLDVDFEPIKGTKAIPITFAHNRRTIECHPQDAAYSIIHETLRDNLMAALNHVIYLDEVEASERMSSREWTHEDITQRQRNINSSRR
jgi:hypothetical protein